VSEGLVRKYGRRRIFDWPPDEASLIGGGIGFAQAGCVPIVEIPYAAYLSCGYNQFVEACFFHWLSNGKQQNGMVFRMQGFDEGVFGGHFHTANAPPVFGVPGIDVVAFSNGKDWARGLRTALRSASRGGVCMLLDSTALLNRKHLHRGDGAWQFGFPAASDALLFDDVVLYRHDCTPTDALTIRQGSLDAMEATEADVAVVTYGNGVPKALEARMTGQVRFDVIDCPLLSRPPAALLEVLRGRYSALLLVDPCRQGAAPFAHFISPLQAARVLPPRWCLRTATPTYNPLGRTITFVSTSDIADWVRELVAQ